MNPETQKTTNWVLPLAIVIGFGLIALAIFFSGGGGSNQTPNQISTGQATDTSRIRPVDETDYIKGNPNAPILIVEYSDYDCPFCKNFHETMNRLMDEYGVTGRVGWVYRQFPLTEIHPNAARISMNALCVGEIAGNDAFWKFTDLVFQERNMNEPTNITRLPEYAESVGVDRGELVRCLQEERTKARLERDITDAMKVGFRSTPHSFVIVGNQIAAIEGAQPYGVVKSIIDNLLTQLEGTSNI